MTFTTPNSAGFADLDEANTQASHAWLDVAERRGARVRKKTCKRKPTMERGWTDAARAASLLVRRAKGFFRPKKRGPKLDLWPSHTRRAAARTRTFDASGRMVRAHGARVRFY